MSGVVFSAEPAGGKTKRAVHSRGFFFKSRTQETIDKWSSAKADGLRFKIERALKKVAFFKEKKDVQGSRMGELVELMVGQMFLEQELGKLAETNPMVRVNDSDVFSKCRELYCGIGSYFFSEGAITKCAVVAELCAVKSLDPEKSSLDKEYLRLYWRDFKKRWDLDLF